MRFPAPPRPASRLAPPAMRPAALPSIRSSFPNYDTAGSNCDTARGHLHAQNLAASHFNRGCHALLSAALDEKERAATAARTADFRSERSSAPGQRDQTIDHGRGYAGHAAAPVPPIFAQQAAGLRPIGFFDSHAHGGSDRRNVPEVALHFSVAVDVGFGDLPIVDAGIAGC